MFWQTNSVEKVLLILSSQENAQKSLESIALHQIDNDTDTSLILHLGWLVEMSLKIVQSQIRSWKIVTNLKIKIWKGFNLNNSDNLVNARSTKLGEILIEKHSYVTYFSRYMSVLKTEDTFIFTIVQNLNIIPFEDAIALR